MQFRGGGGEQERPIDDDTELALIVMGTWAIHGKTGDQAVLYSYLEEWVTVVIGEREGGRQAMDGAISQPSFIIRKRWYGVEGGDAHPGVT